jgi:hypothetical protein
MFGVCAGYHRYFSHRTYKMGRVMQFLMALLGTLSVQKGRPLVGGAPPAASQALRRAPGRALGEAARLLVGARRLDPD